MITRTLPEKWKLLFNSLLKTRYPTGAEFEIESGANEIIFTTQKADVADSLKAILNSPEAARANLNYTLTEEHKPQLTVLENKHYPAPIALVHGDGKTVFEKVFGAEIIRRTGSLPWSGELSDHDSHCAYFTCETQYSRLSRHQMDTYQDFLSSASFDELRNAIAQDATQYVAIPERVNKQGVLADHIDKILHIRSDGQIDTMYFDYGLLIRYLTAPVMVAKADAQQTLRIHIHINHLINYFNMLFPEGFLLHVPDTTGDQQAFPICFSTKGSIPVDNIVSLLLDVSSSMKSDFETYINHVIVFIQKLSAKVNMQNSRLRIVPFNEAFTVNEFLISNKTADLDKIENFLKSLKASGSTHIYAAYNAELTALSQFTEKNNVTVLAFTDGDDVQAKAEKAVNTAKLNDTVKVMSNASHPAQVFTLGLGGSFDAGKLKSIADASHGEFIKLEAIDDFTKIFAHLDKIGEARMLARFVQELGQLSFTVPVYANNISIGTQALQFPRPFNVGAKRYDVKSGGIPLLEKSAGKHEAATAADNLEESADEKALRLLIEKSQAELSAKLAARKRLALFPAKPADVAAPAATDAPKQTRTLH